MKLSEFIRRNIEQILSEWETFAVTLLPASTTMTSLQLRDHAKQILLAVAEDLTTTQTEENRSLKSKGLMTTVASEHTAAAIHGALRHASGFTLLQLSAEFRAMRASALNLWMTKYPPQDASPLDEVMRFNEAIDQALAESIVRYSERVAHSRDIFLGILGHDLRTPVAAIAMAGQILSDPGLAEEKRLKIAAAIGRSTDSMALMIKDLLEYTKISLGDGVPIVRMPSDIEKICKEASDQVRLSQPGRQFRFDAAGDLTSSVDASRLQQVLWNLLNNAFQHGAKDSPVVLTAKGDSEAITLQVQNHGTPIPEESLQSVFDPLVRGNIEESDEEAVHSENLGLGLYIANQIVLAHKGTLTIESTEAGGTVFTARLPRINFQESV